MKTVVTICIFDLSFSIGRLDTSMFSLVGFSVSSCSLLLFLLCLDSASIVNVLSFLLKRMTLLLKPPLKGHALHSFFQCEAEVPANTSTFPHAHPDYDQRHPHMVLVKE